jgi:hypothetical protein
LALLHPRLELAHACTPTLSSSWRSTTQEGRESRLAPSAWGSVCARRGGGGAIASAGSIGAKSVESDQEGAGAQPDAAQVQVEDAEERVQPGFSFPLP